MVKSKVVPEVFVSGDSIVQPDAVLMGRDNPDDINDNPSGVNGLGRKRLHETQTSNLFIGMAVYKHDNYLRHRNDPVFDILLEPGTAAPHPGVYRCEICGHEIIADKAHPLPPASHKHNHPQDDIHWRLTVRTA